MILRFKELPELSPNKFQPDNSVLWLGVPTPCYFDTANGCIKVDDDFALVGWCRNPPARFMNNREGQILLMVFSELDGECWQHYPLYNEEDYEAARFDTKRGLA